uniref:YdbS-like PH domain-containing protein n=1 Tax=Rhizochromulina marina TaxID=1034831 RepID=A0A7S2SV15_9STRA|mmetsp:Transcript_813/g.2602  ORF Transcript_813/g.2602 Transcript_813/m.2602 type:complete len:213 (+) Transcript_813:37-675(+)
MWCTVALLLGVTALQGSHGFQSPLVTPRALRSPAAAFRAPAPVFARRKGDLFEELSEIEESPDKSSQGAEATGVVEAPAKEKSVLEPEVVFFEGPPSWTEVVLPTISILTVIGIVPFIATLSRQFWVKYKITSRRVSVQSGIGGKDLTEITYDEIYLMKFVYRSFGTVGDMVITLRDGARLEMRSVPNFKEVYQYIFDKVGEDVQEYSDKLN